MIKASPIIIFIICSPFSFYYIRGKKKRQLAFYVSFYHM
nr:MAG TPA: hypothetical protein [Caudoviricetes sp.]